MRLYYAYDIVWDTDGEDQDELGLPERATVHAASKDDVAGILSDELGYPIETLEVSECNDELAFF